MSKSHFVHYFIHYKNSIIRLEIDSYSADYFPEYDAVQLVGTESFPPSVEETLKLDNIIGLTNKVMNLGLHQLNPGFSVIESVQKFCFSVRSSESSSKTNYLSLLPVFKKFFLALSQYILSKTIIKRFIFTGGNYKSHSYAFGPA